jgi:threonine dehydratase
MLEETNTRASIADLELGAAIEEAAERLGSVVTSTPLQRSKRLSTAFGADVLLKREDLQEVRSFKIRGAYNKIASLSPDERRRGVVCSSAGNHAQGVAFAAADLRIPATIFMPATTPTQKIERVKHFGREYVEVRLVGESYDDASQAALAFQAAQGAVFVHPFDDPLTIAGQGTVAREVVQELGRAPDVLVAAVGGGGLISGVASYLKARDGRTVVVGAEPAGAPGMGEARRAGQVVTLGQIDTFVDGAAVKRVGDLTYEFCQEHVDDLLLVPEGKVCTTMIELYQNEGIIAEPAGALSVAALDELADRVRGQTVVCILSGGNNDILRYPEVMERSLVHQGRKHYFIVEFAQKPGQLRRFVDQALGPTDDIVRFEYMKKTNKERGAALVGIELRDQADLAPLLERMEEIQLNCRLLTSEELLYEYLI